MAQILETKLVVESPGLIHSHQGFLDSVSDSNRKMLSLEPSVVEMGFSEKGNHKGNLSVKAVSLKEKENYGSSILESGSLRNPGTRSSTSYAEKNIRNYKELMERRKSSKARDGRDVREESDSRRQRVTSFDKAQKMRKYLEKFSGVYSKADEKLQKKFRSKSPALLTLKNP